MKHSMFLKVSKHPCETAKRTLLQWYQFSTDFKDNIMGVFWYEGNVLFCIICYNIAPTKIIQRLLCCIMFHTVQILYPKSKNLKDILIWKPNTRQSGQVQLKNEMVWAGMTDCSLSTAERQTWLIFYYTLKHKKVVLDIFTKRSLSMKATKGESMKLLLWKCIMEIIVCKQDNGNGYEGLFFFSFKEK